MQVRDGKKRQKRERERLKANEKVGNNLGERDWDEDKKLEKVRDGIGAV